MADYIGSLNGTLNGEKTLEKKNEIYVKKLEVSICDLQTFKIFMVALPFATLNTHLAFSASRFLRAEPLGEGVAEDPA